MSDSPQTSGTDATRQAYDRLAAIYDHVADANEHEAREAGQESLNLQPHESVLEVGYGPGRALADFARRVGKDGRVVGIDLSEGMAAAARARLEREGLIDRVQLDIGDARELPYENDRFDAAFLSFTLELFEEDDIPRVLGQLRRVLRPGGRLAIVSMATRQGEPESLLTRVYRWCHRHFPHFVDCRPIPAARLLEAAGFELLEREDREIWTLPVVVLLARSPD